MIIFFSFVLNLCLFLMHTLDDIVDQVYNLITFPPQHCLGIVQGMNKHYENRAEEDSL